jgi:hypothetical protein
MPAVHDSLPAGEGLDRTGAQPLLLGTTCHATELSLTLEQKCCREHWRSHQLACPHAGQAASDGLPGLQVMDGNNEISEINLRKEFFSTDNIASLFQKYNVPKMFDHLTIDIDLVRQRPLLSYSAHADCHGQGGAAVNTARHQMR